ncbi:MAG: PKD domain-containing protein [Saprospiraceae bacterium]|nr:PKD domain-containing protein [Saprospiraceae bacterium]
MNSKLFSQDYTVNFLKGQKQFENNILEISNTNYLIENEIFNDRFYRFLQFYSIPTEIQQEEIANTGIKLLEYIPNMVYVASIPTNLDLTLLADLNIKSIIPIDYMYKVDQRLEEKDYPSWSMEGNYITITITFFQDIDPEIAKSELKALGIGVMESMDHAHMAVAQVMPNKIETLVKLPFIRYAEIISEPGEPESDDGRHLHRANAIDGDFLGARNYDGTGITFAINDDGYVGPHIDFNGRTNQQDVSGDNTGTHGDMTTGIAGGAGNLDPLMRGMATGSYIHVRQYNSSMGGTIPLHQDSSVLIFSSSYSNGCNGGYTSTTVLMDQEIYNNPTLLQTFSAGNSNNQDCGYGAGTQWGNITGGHKIGKNVIATANLNEVDGIISSSSRGPASDGRIKPDIAAHGNSQMSTDPNNSYAPGGGTSAAAPGICGVTAQLHQAYKDLKGTIAPSALLKATMLNTANDLGNDGPDFTFGWGKINALKALNLLEEDRYFSNTISQGDSNIHSITIPPGVLRAKIMVYWSDKEASTSSATALINDLDATVTAPNSSLHLPWILDHTPNATTLALPATKGVDHLNNMEQIAIDNPDGGTYDLKIKGTTVPFGPQEYYVVYEFLMNEITLIHPMGGEGLIPGSSERIHWDAYGTSGTFMIEYTVDNGSNWNNITSFAAGTSRIENWTVPNTVTGEARIRITRGSVTDESDANFTIIDRPQNIIVNRVCPDISAIQLAWDSVPGATGYDIFMLGQKFMDSVGTTSALNYNVIVSDINDEQWFSVRAIGPNGLRGLRQIAVYYSGNSTGGSSCFLACTGDNDAGISSLDSPSSFLETCSGITTASVTISLENLGLYTESNFPVYYQFGSNPLVTETYTNSLPPGGSGTYTFSTPIIIPPANNYELKTWTGLLSDSTVCNDTVTQSITIMDPLSSFPYAENFEGGLFPPPSSYIINSDNDKSWEAINTTGSSGSTTSAMYVNNYDYNAAGQEDIFSFVTLDMTQAASGATAMLTFDVAYRRYNNTYSDDLRIDLSTDCGQNFTQVYFKDGSNLATGADATSSWAPSSSSDWRNDTIDLSSYLGNNIVLRFVNICGWGQNLYIDNINVSLIGALPPVAEFSSDVVYSCDGSINFVDLSGNQPTQWLWNFGDGGVATQQNPSYTYSNSGIYNVSLQVTNSLGMDTIIKNAYLEIEYPTITSTINGAGCPNTSIPLSATYTNGKLNWYDGAGNLTYVGDTFNTPPLISTTNYQVQNIILTPILNVGPSNPTSVGGGNYHNSGFTGVINFTAYNDFELISVWVDADGSGPRTITLWDSSITSGNGTITNNILDQKTVNLVDGEQRVYLNFYVPGPGEYSIGGSNVDLYRNNDGVNYPYTIPNIVSLNSSSATSSGDYYYYLYDWNIRLDSCAGNTSTVVAEVFDASFSSVINGNSVAFNDMSTGATNWFWDFGDGNNSTQQNPTHTYTTTGNYLVTLSINNGACSFSDSVSVLVGIEDLNNTLNLVISPNPATNETTLRFSKKLTENLYIEIIGLDGKVLKRLSMSHGKIEKTLDLRFLPPAMYLLRLTTAEITDTRKIIVSN